MKSYRAEPRIGTLCIFATPKKKIPIDSETVGNDFKSSFAIKVPAKILENLSCRLFVLFFLLAGANIFASDVASRRDEIRKIRRVPRRIQEERERRRKACARVCERARTMRAKGMERAQL